MVTLAAKMLVSSRKIEKQSTWGRRVGMRVECMQVTQPKTEKNQCEVAALAFGNPINDAMQAFSGCKGR